jgi:predicted ATPase/class 3 adenylate cyclase/Tfp pilus assembly protein PilF
MPTAIRTLLLTDVVGSTDLTRRLGDAEAGRWWATNDRIAREQLRRWRGREIDRTDGMLMLFESTEDALGCALAYHAALAAEGAPFLARAGVHRAPVTLIENSADDVSQGAKPLDVEGLALATVARVMSAAQGGQTLISAEALRTLPVPPEDAAPRWRSHGHWRLGGLGEPVELFELVRAGFAAEPPQDQPKAYRVRRDGGLWKPLREIAHSLPAERDSFIGRQEPLARLAALLDGGARLVTVTGMGGVGKTRLALRCAWSWLGEYPGGVWFCDLAAARDLAGVQRAVAQGLGVPLAAADPGLQLARAIDGHGRCLLILDNFEQVAALAEATIGLWLDRAAQARFVATSRERLSLVGETVLDLQPMPAAEAVSLFERRAEAAGAAGTPVEHADAGTIARLVDMLDCLPLAIELAAARARVMSPRVLLSRMHERFKLLATRLGRQDRRSTLRATIDWSWELLSPAEQALLAQLSVFVGGFTLEACERVAWVPDPPGGSHLDLLHALLDRSLVRRCSGERFDLLQTVRAYAADRLVNGSVDAQAAVDRHAGYYVSLGPQRIVEDSCIELDNLIAACRRAVAIGDAGLTCRALSAAHAGLSLRGPWRVLAELGDAALGLVGLDPAQRLSVLLDCAPGHRFGGAVDRAKGLYAQALALSEEVTDPVLLARVGRAKADQALAGGDSALWARLMDEAMANAERSGDNALLCSLLNRSGAVLDTRGHHDQARARYEHALALARRVGARRWEGGSAGNLGQWFFNQGRLDEAGAMYREAVAIAGELGDRQWEANTRSNLGLLLMEQGKPDLAGPELECAVSAAQTLGHPHLLAISLCNLGLVTESLGRLGEAEAKFARAIEVSRTLGDQRIEGQCLGYLGLLLSRLGRAPEATACLERARQLLRASNDQLSLGIVLAQTAIAERLAGDVHSADRALDEARTIAECIADLRPESELARALHQAQAITADSPGRATSKLR